MRPHPWVDPPRPRARARLERIVAGKHNKGAKSVMAAVNAKAGRKCPAGMVAAVLRDFFGLRVKQENICSQCNRRCTKANCGTHYGSASGKRNRLMVCWDAALKPAA